VASGTSYIGTKKILALPRGCGFMEPIPLLLLIDFLAKYSAPAPAQYYSNFEFPSNFWNSQNVG